MISPHTPPGAKVVAVGAGRMVVHGHFPIVHLEVGREYTLRSIQVDPNYLSGFKCTVEEIYGCAYGLGLFRPPITPERFFEKTEVVEGPIRRKVTA